MKDALLIELAGTWELMADMGGADSRSTERATLRMCADTLRMLVQTAGDRQKQEDCPHAEPFRYCPRCPVSPCPIGLGTAKKEGRDA